MSAAPPANEPAATDAAWARRGAPEFLGGHRVRLLQGGDELFPAMREAIAQARHEVWLSTYIFHDDDAARAMATTLAEAGRRGVRVLRGGRRLRLQGHAARGCANGCRSPTSS